MSGQEIAELIASITGGITSLTALIGVPIFFYRRGQIDRETVLSLKAVTVANENLAQRFDRFAEKTTDTIHAHDLRISRVEPNGESGYSNGRRTR